MKKKQTYFVRFYSYVLAKEVNGVELYENRQEWTTEGNRPDFESIIELTDELAKEIDRHFEEYENDQFFLICTTDHEIAVEFNAVKLGVELYHNAQGYGKALAKGLLLSRLVEGLTDNYQNKAFVYFD